MIVAVAAEVQHPVLKGLRLGKRDRFVLLHAAPPGTEWWRVQADEDGRAAHEATLRAARKLWNLELVDINKYGGRNGRKVRLTPFGAALIEQYRRELELGISIRWDQRVDEAWASSRPVAAEQDAGAERRRIEMQALAARAGGTFTD